MKQRTIKFLQKYWAFFAIILIVALGTQIRLLDYQWSYLRNIDSYNFARQMEEISANGGLPDVDTLSLAPYGAARAGGSIDFYVYLGAYTYNFTRLFIPNLSWFNFLLWFPAILASLSAVPIYFIGKTFFDRKAGVLAAFFLIFDPSIISRTLGGDPDSDGIVLIMPLIAMAIFLIAYKYANSTKKFDTKYILYTILSGIAMGLWGLTWIGYWYVLWLITGFLLVPIIAEIIKKRKLSAIGNFKHGIIVFFVTIIIFFLITIPVIGTFVVTQTFYGPFSFGEIKSEENNQFPNVYVSVAELQSSGDVKDVIQRAIGMNFSQNALAIIISPFFLMIYGLIYLIYSYAKKRQHFDTLVLLLIWFVGPFIATIAAVRFSVLFSAPIAIGAGIFLAKLLRMITEGEKIED
ncbi:MAG: hypothetical protein NT120_00855 [Candidatus Aenigmarchaeota archaeon]|nr:hypothetical protein [Candidatus Aenigmarchaeota archaeon]